MNATLYAEALYRALEGKNERVAEKIVSRLKEVLVMRGHTSLARRIALEFARTVARKEKEKTVTLITADEKSRKKWMHAYNHYEREGLLPKCAPREDVLDETIVSGFRIRTNTIEIDGSGRRILLDLYRNILQRKDEK